MPKERLGFFTARRARQISEAVDMLMNSGLLRPGVLHSLLNPPKQSLPFLHFRNESGEIIPPYACMQCVGTYYLENRIYMSVEKPQDIDGTAGPYLFNKHREVEVGEDGSAQLFTRVRAIYNAGNPVAGQKWQPTIGQWYLTQDDSGSFTAMGIDDPMSNDGGGRDIFWVETSSTAAAAGVQFYLTPSGGIPARSGSTLGSATCTLLSLDSGTRTVTATTRTVYNDFLSAVGGSVDIAAALVDGIWVVIAEDCT